MKTYRNLYPTLCSFENLLEAYRQARKGKRGQEEVADFELCYEDHLFQLQEELLARTYQPGDYRHFTITHPKRRLVSAAPFRDRVVHHALVQVIEPIWEARFCRDSYANRVGKGTHAALDRCTQFARRYRYVLMADVVQFFASVDHAALRSVLARHIADDGVLWLCNRILQSGAGVLADEYDMVYYPGDDLWAAQRPRSLPIGNLTSQFWGNVVLNELDQFVKHELRCSAYIRYVDDLRLFSNDTRELHRWRVAIGEYLATLRLRLHERQAVVFPVDCGIPFLGFRVYPDHRRLKRRNLVSFRRHFKSLVAQYTAGEIDLERLTAAAQGWAAHAAHGDTHGLRRAVLGHVAVPRAPAQTAARRTE